MKIFERIDANPLASEFYYPGGEAGILLMHGFMASPAQMRRLGVALRDEGYTVLGLRLPGHGTHITEMEQSNWREWIGAAREGMHRLAKSCRHIYAAGLSMGGALSLILAEEFDLCGVIPVAAPMRLFDPLLPYTRIIKLFMRYRDYKDYNPDSENIAYSAIPVRKVQDLYRIMSIAEKGLSNIKCPMLIVQGLKDRTVKPKSAQIIYDKAVNCSAKQILYLEESPHVCIFEPEFDKLRDGIVKFLKASQKFNAQDRS